MKVAVSTEGDSVCSHFGRCPVFTIAEIADGKIIKTDVVENPGHQPGMVPEFLKGMSVECVAAGGMGARAEEIFRAAGIRIVVGVVGKVAAALDGIAAGELKSSGALCAGGHGDDGHGCDHHNGADVCDTSKK